MREENKETACVKFYCGDCAPKGKRLDTGTFLAKCSKCGTKTYCKAGISLCGAIQVTAGITSSVVELTEETEAVEDAVTEPLGPITEEAIELEKEPKETPVEAESKPLNEMMKSELLATIKEREIDAAAEIAELEAKLAKLKPTK